VSEEQALTVVQQRELTPTVLDMFQQLDQAAYQSRRFGVTQGETVIKLLFCYENNLPLSTANTGLYVVNGKLGLESNVIAAQFRRHPSYDYRIKEQTTKGCTIEVLRDGDVIGEASFVKEDAERAGLLSKDNWKKYPEDMYYNRALSRAYKRFAPDLFSQSVYVREELEEVVDATYTVQPAPEPETSRASLDDLVAEYGADAVLAANGGAIPATDEEVAAVAERLGDNG